MNDEYINKNTLIDWVDAKIIENDDKYQALHDFAFYDSFYQGKVKMLNEIKDFINNECIVVKDKVMLNKPITININTNPDPETIKRALCQAIDELQDKYR